MIPSFFKIEIFKYSGSVTNGLMIVNWFSSPLTSDFQSSPHLLPQSIGWAIWFIKWFGDFLASLWHDQQVLAMARTSSSRDASTRSPPSLVHHPEESVQENLKATIPRKLNIILLETTNVKLLHSISSNKQSFCSLTLCIWSGIRILIMLIVECQE